MLTSMLQKLHLQRQNMAETSKAICTDLQFLILPKGQHIKLLLHNCTSKLKLSIILQKTFDHINPYKHTVK